MTDTPQDNATAAPSVAQQVRTMGWNFWIANVMEALERLAYFGVRAVLPLYMVATDGGGLGLSFSEKGLIYMLWALVQCLLPMVSGGFTDAYGYKKSLYVAFSFNIAGYVVLGLLASLSGPIPHAIAFGAMLGAALLIGTGTALFKPPVQGAVAKSLDAGNSSLGFGIFYWVVNIGGFIAPMAAAWARGDDASPTWHYVFYGAAIVTAINFLPTLLLFREPERNAEAAKKSPLQVLVDTMRVLFDDKGLLRFLLVVSGFWLMFMQLWDLLPNFLDEWVDTRSVGAFLTSLLGDGAASFLTPSGAAKPEILINIDSAAIILLVLPLSWFFGRYKMMTSLVLGMCIALVGFVLSGMTTSGTIAALAIFVFAIGEIICSPKFNEYIGMTAPPDKKAIYMGFVNIPFAIGWAAGNGLSGFLYDGFSSKQMLARRFLVEHHAGDAAALAELKGEALYAQVMAALGEGAGMAEVNEALWNGYHPWIIWPMLGAVGLFSLVGMILLHTGKKGAAAEAAANDDSAAPANASTTGAGTDDSASTGALTTADSNAVEGDGNLSSEAMATALEGALEAAGTDALKAAEDKAPATFAEGGADRSSENSATSADQS